MGEDGTDELAAKLNGPVMESEIRHFAFSIPMNPCLTSM
jgi:hypothetical protein